MTAPSRFILPTLFPSPLLREYTAAPSAERAQHRAYVDQHSELTFPVVGLGASAGGLAALTTFFEALPPSPGAAFVVVLHLSPSHESHSAAILQRATSLAVTQVTGDTKLQGNHVYVIPPGHSLTMTDGKLCLGENERLRGRPIVIDMFFRTLAMAHGPRAFAVVLSGTGADGAVGIADIKGQGGVVLAQHPDDAEYEGMPASAIATGQVDIVLPAAQLGPKVVDLWANAQKIEGADPICVTICRSSWRRQHLAPRKRLRSRNLTLATNARAAEQSPARARSRVLPVVAADR